MVAEVSEAVDATVIFSGREGRRMDQVGFLKLYGSCRQIEHVAGFRGFSMADEARHTSQHPSHWDAGGILRSKPVSFVSAGPIEPLKELEQDLSQQMAKDVVKEPDQPQPSPPSLPIAEMPEHMISDDEIQDALLNTGDGEDCDDADDVSSVIGPEELEQDIVRATRTDKEKSADQPQARFFFDLKGDRRAGSAPKPPVPIRSRSRESDSSSGDEVILFKGRDATPIRRAPEPTSATESTKITLTQMETEIRAVEADLSVPGTTHRGRSKRVKGVFKGKRTGPGQRHRLAQESDDDDAAIMADYLTNMRENGEMSDLLNSQLPDARNTRDLGGSGNEEIYDHGPEESEPHSRAFQQQKQEAKNGSYESGSELDDTTLAKLLQGHMPGTEEELTFEGFASSSSESPDSEDGPPAFGQGGHQTLDIDDFDLMDWSRPSLRKKKSKASRAPITFDVSDDDLQQTLQMAWKNDRLKKSERKKQREELRALGMLGRHASKPGDLRTKYPAGMDVQQVGEEIKGFLRGSAETYVYYEV